MNFTRNLSFGKIGVDVAQLQIGLNTLGYGPLRVIGIFGPKTMAAVSKFQKDNDIDPSAGFFGPITQPIFLKKLSGGNRDIFYRTAVSCLGTDASPNDVAPDEYGCAETVNDVHGKAFGFPIGGSVSTHMLYQALQSSTFFTRVDIPAYGDIIISPTGYGSGGLSNGHVGIMYDNYRIMSNSSSSGTFEINYNMDSWRKRYVDIGGYPMAFFRRI